MKTKLTWFDRMMLGVTFAEANMPSVARELTGKAKHGDTKCQCCEKREHCADEEQEVHARAAKI